MKRFLQSEIGAAVLWVASTLLLAAVISPWIYQAGKAIAAATEAGDYPAFIESLGRSCGRAKVGRYFSRSLLISALCLMPFLWRRIRTLKSSSAALPAPRASYSKGQVAVQVVTGCALAATLLFALGLLTAWWGAYAAKDELPSLGRIVSKAVLPAVGASLLEEWLFRGVLLGLWLRFARPVAACVGSSLLFAFLHFLTPPKSAGTVDPASAFSGFELLGKILHHFTDPLFFVTDFATLTLVGLILAWARVRTGALWFSIGLHAGWVLAFQAFSLFYKIVPSHPLRPWGIGDDLRSGVLPFIALALTAVICHLVMKRFPAPANRASR